MVSFGNMLEIKNLKLAVFGKEILAGVNLVVRKREIVVIFGPNGSGKTSLLKAIAGIGGYKVFGEIIFCGKKIGKLTPDQRANLGVALMFQKPPKISGLKLENILTTLTDNKVFVNQKAKDLNFENFLPRTLNDNFSGGEIKRSELLQLFCQKAKLFLLDEPDSGVDLDNVKLVGRQINKLVSGGKSAIIVTHSGAILPYINAKKAFVLVSGKIACSGSPKKVLATIKKYGYKKCTKCKKKVKN